MAADDVDFDAEKVDGQRPLAEAGKADGILFRRDHGPGAARLAPLEHPGDLAFAEAMMVGEAAGINQLDAQLAQALLEALRLGDAGNHADAQVFEEGERHDFVRENFLEVERLVRALDKVGMVVVPAQLGAQFGEIAPLSFLKDLRIGMISGIAKPESFEEGLRKLGVELIYSRRFADHHRFSENEIAKMFERSKARGARAVITTEKDSVRFPRLGKRPLPIYFLRVEIEIIRGHDAFNRCLEQMCRYDVPADAIPLQPVLAST